MGFRLVVNRLVAIGYPEAIREFEYDHSFAVRYPRLSVCLSVCLSLCLSVCLSLCINVSLCLWVLVKPPPQKLGLYVSECDSVFVFVWSVYMSGTRLIGPTVLAAGPAMSDLSTAGQLGQCPTLWPVVRCAHWKTQRRQWSRPLLSVTWTAVTRCATASTTNWHATCSQFRMLSPGSWRTPGDVIVFRLRSLRQLHWLSLQQRFVFQIATLVHRSLFGNARVTWVTAGPQVWNSVSQNMSSVTRPVQTVTEDIFIWTVRPRRSVNCFLRCTPMNFF